MSHTALGAGFGLDYGVHNNSFVNVRRGLVERVCYRNIDGKLVSVPQPQKDGYSDLTQIAEEIVSHMPICRRITRRQFVDSYVGRRRQVYERAAESLARRPVCVADGYMSTFSKAEKINRSAKPDPCPRVIQPRGPRYNVELGRALKRMEVKLKEAVAEVWGGPTVMKGYNASQTGVQMWAMWREFRDPVAIPIDAVRFDQHVSKPALQWEHSVYLKCLQGKDRTAIEKLLAMQLENKGFARTAEGNIKYTVVGRRMSGDMNTGMGNCLLMCAMMLGFIRAIKVRARLANNGDDCVLFVEREDEKRVRAAMAGYFLQKGFTLEVEPTVDVFEQITFCQTNPVLGPDGTYVMVRDPRVAIDKDCYTMLPMQAMRDMKFWAHNIGSCNLALGRGMPLWQDFAQMLLRFSGPTGRQQIAEQVADSGMYRLSIGMESKTTPISAETRLSFWRAFGITPDLQDVCESHYRTHQLHFAKELNSPFSTKLTPLKYTFA